MKPRKLHLYVIESASDNSEAFDLQRKLARTDISIIVRIVDNKKAFLSTIQSAMIHFSAHRAKIPLLHISVHGCEKGIQLSNGESITWGELGAAIGTDLSDKLILCMSTCEGLRSWGMALMEDSPHYHVLVGTEKKPGWNDTKAGFPLFYQSLAHGKTIERALDSLKKVSGHPYFLIVPGVSVWQIRQEVVSCKTLDEVHRVRDKYRLRSRRHERFSPVYPFKPLREEDRQANYTS
jgi:hypothetical protein